MAAPQRRATIRDVAGAAGISVGTASHALNGTGRVSAATRERVVAVAGRLGYRPDPRGRALRSARTMTLGLLLPLEGGVQRSGTSLGADFYLELAGAAADAAFAHDHGLLLLPAARDPAELERFVIDGAMVSDPEPGDARLKVLDALEIPTVTLERDLADPQRSWWVVADNARGVRALLAHLVSEGARSVALLTVNRAWSWIADVEAAYGDWCAGAGIEPLVVSVAAGAPLDVIDREATRLLASHRPDAIIAPPERLACAAARAALQLGLRVPDDVRIAACVDGREVRAADITALDLIPEAHAVAGVELLLQRLNGGPPATRHIDSQLRIRGSSR
jgi:DNA-binding LacI/PurR family transcriptional regulator